MPSIQLPAPTQPPQNSYSAPTATGGVLVAKDAKIIEKQGLRRRRADRNGVTTVQSSPRLKLNRDGRRHRGRQQQSLARQRYSSPSRASKVACPDAHAPDGMKRNSRAYDQLKGKRLAGFSRFRSASDLAARSDILHSVYRS
jgi:hypothetical protein